MYKFFSRIVSSLILLVSLMPTTQSQTVGAWENIETTDSAIVEHMLLLGDNYFTLATYKVMNGQFISTQGGSWAKSGQKLTIKYEFNSAQPQLVGTTVDWPVVADGNKFQFNGKLWSKVVPVQQTELSGVFQMGGRKQSGEIVMRNTNQPRKTMKFVLANRFQWIAFNTETKEFLGTGGGTYTAKDGVYTEQIEFFSRNIDRVGASLSFGYDIKNDGWHHSGKSSAGEDMYEVWVVRK